MALNFPTSTAEPSFTLLWAGTVVVCLLLACGFLGEQYGDHSRHMTKRWWAISFASVLGAVIAGATIYTIVAPRSVSSTDNNAAKHIKDTWYIDNETSIPQGFINNHYTVLQTYPNGRYTDDHSEATPPLGGTSIRLLGDTGGEVECYVDFDIPTWRGMQGRLDQNCSSIDNEHTLAAVSAKDLSGSGGWKYDSAPTDTGDFKAISPQGKEYTCNLTNFKNSINPSGKAMALGCYTSQNAKSITFVNVIPYPAS